MAKYTEDDSTFQLMNDDGSVQSSINKADVNPNTIAALKKVNEPLYKEKPEDPNATGFLADIKKAGKITSEGLGGAPALSPTMSQIQNPAPAAPMAKPVAEALAAAKPLQQSRISGGLPSGQGMSGPQPQPQLSMTTSEVKTSPQQFEQDRKLYEQTVVNAKAEQEAIKARAEIEKLSLDEQAKVLEHQEIKKAQLAETQQALLQEQRDKIQVAQDNYNKIYEENKNKDFGIFSKGTGNGILAALSIGLGAIGGAMSRQGGNLALDIINKNIDSEMQQSREKLMNAKENIGITRAAYDERLASINAQGAAMWDQVAKKAQEMGVKTGSAMANANAQQLVAQAQQKSLALQSDALEKLRPKTVTTTSVAEKETGSQKFSQDQSNAAIFGKRIMDAEKDFADIQRQGYNPAASSRRATKLLPEELKGELTQRQEQAERNFLTAVLRKESGSAISKEELETGKLQYFPQPGNTEAVLKQKKRNRDAALAGMKVAAGDAFRAIVAQSKPSFDTGAPVK